MIKCISYWSMKDGLRNSHPIEDALTAAGAAGFAGMELCIGPEGVLNTRTTEKECRAIRDQIDASGLVVETLASGMSWGCNPVSDDARVRSEAVRLNAAALQRAAWLGCRAYLFVPGVVCSPISPGECVRYDRAVERTRDVICDLLETAERVSVDLAIENVWNGLFCSPMELAGFIDSIGSQRLGVYFDVGNVLRYHQHPPHWIELLGWRIKRIHVKGYKEEFGATGRYAFCDLLEGDVPWTESMEALRSIGYDGTIVAEMMPWREDLLDVTSRAMDEILAL